MTAPPRVIRTTPAQQAVGKDVGGVGARPRVLRRERRAAVPDRVRGAARRVATLEVGGPSRHTEAPKPAAHPAGGDRVGVTVDDVHVPK